MQRVENVYCMPRCAGESVYGKSLAELAEKLLGPSGSSVECTFRKEVSKEMITVKPHICSCFACMPKGHKSGRPQRCTIPCLPCPACSASTWIPRIRVWGGALYVSVPIDVHTCVCEREQVQLVRGINASARNR
jgi:hypothetical protein